MKFDLAFLRIIFYSVLDTLRVSLYRPEEKRMKAASLFFIFSMGRSGTQFFSSLLDKDNSAVVVHEPTRRDALEYIRSFNNRYDSYAYVNGFKKKLIFWNMRRYNANVYGEVNSNLRRHAPAIMTSLPNVKGLFLIRDGRDVVRSMMAVDIQYILNNVILSCDDPFFDRWRNWGKFEKCCWLWASENAALYRQFGTALKFESLLSDYDYFKMNMLDPLKLDINKDVWKKEKNIKSKNQTIKFTMDEYKTWTVMQQENFREICGYMMEKHEYE